MYNKKQLIKKWVLSALFSVFLSVSVLFGQDHWIQVSNPHGVVPLLEVFGESYFQMPPKLMEPFGAWSKGTFKELLLPNEKGEEEVFKLTPVAVLSNALQKNYPRIRTYTGHSVTRHEVSIRLTSSPQGISAWMHFKDAPDFFIQPVKGEKNLHFTYIKSTQDSDNRLFCKTKAAVSKKPPSKGASKSKVLNQTIKTFRIAIAGTGEYTSFWGDNEDSNGTNSEDALAAVVSTINRINFIFERDLNLRLELVSDAGLMYENAELDPFTGNFDTELQSTLDQVLGNEAYDVGHLFDFGEPNGDAGCIGCVCVSNKKGQGFSTHPFRDIYGGEYRNDYFDLDYVGHEIGHQFGAYHTYSFETEGTGYNAEPGSGSTIMGYAGITGVDDLQQHGDSYFHYYSIQNILEYTATLSCGSTESIEVESFSISAGPDHFIPIGTAFQLEIPPIEAEEGVSYTYTWEQLDSGEITSSNFGPNNILGAIARSLPPKTSSGRVVPSMSRVLNNELTQEKPGLNDAWETVPLLGRIMNWGLSVRKQTPTFSQIAQDQMLITVVEEAGPFGFISHDKPLILKGGALETLLWNAANTQQSPINADQVSVLMSTDGGTTFPVVLAQDLPNNGRAVVRIPNDLDTTRARIKIKPKGTIFFAVNASDLSIESRDLALNFGVFSKENCDENTLRYDFTIEKATGFNEDVILQIVEPPAGVEFQFSKEIYTSSDNSGYLVISGLGNLSAGDYLFDLKANYGNAAEIFSIELKQRTTDFVPVVKQTPKNLEVGLSINPLLEWEKNPNAEHYRVQVSSDTNYTSILLDSIVASNKLKLKNLAPLSTYYWRIQNQNNCGDSVFSESSSFETGPISCTSLIAANLPKELNDATETDDGVTVATINISFDAPILDLNVVVDLTHTWLQDLSLYLETPEGKRLLLSSSLGESGDNYTQTIFDQEATTSIKEGSPPFRGSYKPIQDISALYGTPSKGLWKLIIIDQYKEDSGALIEFGLQLCVEGIIEPDRDGDSYPDSQDNCPEISNLDQADVDQNGIGDLCDLFSERNLSLSKKDASCPNKENGSLTFNARADFPYEAEIVGPNGFQKTVNFSLIGNTLTNLAPGGYTICITTKPFPEFEYCFETQINAPEELNVQASYNPITSIVDLNLSGSETYTITINDIVHTISGKQSVQLPLTKKINRVRVSTSKICQGFFEEWINLEQQATVFPNPVTSEAQLVLPKKARVDLNLVSGSGEILWSLNQVLESSTPILIPMKNLTRGWYLLQIDYGTRLETHKILKE